MERTCARRHRTFQTSKRPCCRTLVPRRRCKHQREVSEREKRPTIRVDGTNRKKTGRIAHLFSSAGQALRSLVVPQPSKSLVWIHRWCGALSRPLASEAHRPEARLTQHAVKYRSLSLPPNTKPVHLISCLLLDRPSCLPPPLVPSPLTHCYVGMPLALLHPPRAAYWPAVWLPVCPVGAAPPAAQMSKRR